MNVERTKALLRLHEGVRPMPYTDTVGKLTIGVGRNLTDRGLLPSEVEFLLDNDVHLVTTQCMTFPWFEGLDEVRQAVVLDMVFNLGLTSFKTFVNTIKMISLGDYHGAAGNMLQSKWATQVGPRATQLSNMMANGAWPQGVT